MSSLPLRVQCSLISSFGWCCSLPPPLGWCCSLPTPVGVAAFLSLLWSWVGLTSSSDQLSGGPSSSSLWVVLSVELHLTSANQSILQFSNRIKNMYVSISFHFILCYKKGTAAPSQGGRGRQHHQQEEENAARKRTHHRPKERGEEVSLSFRVVLVFPHFGMVLLSLLLLLGGAVFPSSPPSGGAVFPPLPCWVVLPPPLG